MNELWAQKAIKDGVFTLEKHGDFVLEKHPKGHCNGCYFLTKSCPTRAVTICSTGGVIFKKV